MKKILVKIYSWCKKNILIGPYINKIFFYDSFFSSESGRTKQDKQVHNFITHLNDMKKENKKISAIYRVKNGQEFIELAILSVCPLVNEIIFVDNGSTDNTLKIIFDLKKRLKGNVEIKIFHYHEKLSLAGDGYMESVKNYPDTSLAKFYNYCFSLGSGDYLMKCDAHYIFTPKGLIKIYNALKKEPDIIQYSGVEIYGKRMGVEAFVFSRKSGYKFIDDEFYEKLIIPKNKNKVEIKTPVFIHVKRICYAKYNNGNSLLEKYEL